MEARGVRFTHRTLAGVASVCLTVAAALLGTMPALATPTGGVVSSVRSFPATETVRRDLSRESVSTVSDGTWGGVETLNVPVTRSQAEKDAQAKAEAEARRRAVREGTNREQAQTATDEPSASAGASSPHAPLESIGQPSERSGQAVADYAAQYAGYPYVYGGSTPDGWDCSGFVMYVYARFGISLPHSSGAQMNVGTQVASLADAQPGDILANPSHAAIYLGNGMVMNAMSPAQGTGIAPVGTVMGSSYAIRRIF